MKYERIEFYFNKEKNLIAIFPFYDSNQSEEQSESEELKSINNKLENSIVYRNLTKNSNKKSKYIKKALYFNSGEYFKEIKIEFINNKSTHRIEMNEIGEKIFNEKDKPINSIRISTNLRKDILFTVNQFKTKTGYERYSYKQKGNYINDFLFTYKFKLTESDKNKNDKKLKEESDFDNDNTIIEEINLTEIKFNFIPKDPAERLFPKDERCPKKSTSMRDIKRVSIFNKSIPSIPFINERRKSKLFTKGKSCKCINCVNTFINLFLFILILLSSSLIYYYFSQNIYKGVVVLNKSHLKSPSKLHTDEFGFVHIRAANFEDAFFTLGYSHARDRLWQIDFLRRFARGKLSEILGPKALNIDKYMRNMGISFRSKNDINTFYKRKKENLFYGNYKNEDNDLKTQENLKMYEKYIDGLNFYAKNNYLPLEYYILNIRYKKFTLVDCFSIARLISFLLTFDWHVEIFNQILTLKQGPEFMQKFDLWNFRNFPYANETVVGPEEIEKMNLHIKNFDINLIKNFKNYKKDFEFEFEGNKDVFKNQELLKQKSLGSLI